MAEIRPFRGVRYNEQLISDLSTVICPPYDIITPRMAQDLYHRSEYNFVRLEYGRLLPPGAATDERHAHSAAILEQWLKQDVLKRDAQPAIYLHDHTFSYLGTEYVRRSITVATRLVEWAEKVVRPHEATLSKARNDRINLLWTLESNTSPILTLFEDETKQIASRLSHQAQKPPLMSLGGDNGESHRIWAITEAEAVRAITADFSSKPLYIADGHHRYESALTYQRERQACAGETSGDEGFNFVMMTLVDFADPGLIVLSPHRLVRGIGQSALNELRSKLDIFFEIEEWPLDTSDNGERIRASLDREETGQVRFILAGLRPGYLTLLKLRDPGTVRQMIPYFHGDLYAKLDVSILDHVILEEMLGLSSSSQEASLTFCYDQQDAVRRVSDQEYQLAFLLRPVKAATIKAIADSGERMPRKSTYFYPKPPSGLVFNRLV